MHYYYITILIDYILLCSLSPARMGSVAALAEHKLRVLCLHGYGQSAELFRNKTGSLRKAMKSRLEFVYVDGPHAAAPGGRSWFHWEDQGLPNKAVKYKGWEQTEAALHSALQEAQPIHGIVGFSQGATAAALFAAGLPPGTLKFGIFIAGFLPYDEEFAARLDSPTLQQIPTFHIMGEADEIIPLSRSLALSQCAGPHATLFKHPGAHMVPTCTGDVKAAWVTFLESVER